MIGSIAQHCIPTSGIFNAHLWESGIGTVQAMRPRDVLAANFKALLKDRSDLSRFPDITTASKGTLPNGTLDRIRRAKVAITIDKLADLAKVFGVEPWQLLVENLNPKALPRLADAEFLSHIKQIVNSVPAQNAEISPSPTDEQAVKTSSREQQVKVGPALQEAFSEARGKKNARSKSAATQKPKGRRSG